MEDRTGQASLSCPLFLLSELQAESRTSQLLHIREVKLLVLISQLRKLLNPSERQWDGNALLGNAGSSCPSGDFNSRVQHHICLQIYAIFSNLPLLVIMVILWLLSTLFPDLCFSWSRIQAGKKDCVYWTPLKWYRHKKFQHFDLDIGRFDTMTYDNLQNIKGSLKSRKPLWKTHNLFLPNFPFS